MGAIYCDIKDPGRFEAVMAFLAAAEAEGEAAGAVRECASKFSITPAAVRSIRSKAARMKGYDIRLVGGGVTLFVGTFLSCEGFGKACRKAVSVYSGTLKHLELPGWALTDGRETVPLARLLHPDDAERRG